MLRYVIVVGDPENGSDARILGETSRQHADSPTKWRVAISDRSLYAAHVDDDARISTAITLGDQKGVIFGRVFRSGGDGPPEWIRAMSAEASGEIIDSGGRALSTRYWGYYVAVVHDPERKTTRVLRAPASPLACFHLKRGTLSVFFSHLDDCVALGFNRWSINWDSITAQLVGGDYLGHETAIDGVESVECGESIEHTPGGCTMRCLWHPHEFLRHRPIRDFAEAARAMRRSVDASVHALSSGHDGVLVKLSGGLDSSIVLGSLARAPRKLRLTAVNYHSRGCGDERSYARAMAGAAKCRLIEYVRNDHLDLRRFHDCNLTVRPVLNFSAPDVELRNAALAEDVGATAIFDGELGDNIFGRAPSPTVLVECMRQNGVGRRFLACAIDYSMLTRQSFWRTLALARRESLDTSVSFSSSQVLRDLYGAEAADSMRLASADADRHHERIAERFLHPWLNQARSLAPDSYKILIGLIAITSTAYHPPFAAAGAAPRVSPLLSQPLAELALSIPGYLHCTSGQDRAVARAAFADSLSARTLNRGLGKGGPSLWAKDVIARNSEFLREFLLGGELVRRGLLDKNKVETVISSTVVRSTAMLGDVFASLYVEAWVRKFAALQGVRSAAGRTRPSDPTSI
jgi:asparagine synthase (glutamine-hydrolysing)